MGQVSFNRITKTFGDLKALDSITFDIAEGSIHAVLGENGAGKTTLMNILYGFYKPDSGKLLLNGLLVHIDNPRQAIKMDKREKTVNK